MTKVLFLMLALIGAPLAVNAQSEGVGCVSYDADYVGCRFHYYPSGGQACECAGSDRSTAAVLHPGFFLAIRDGERVVDNVIPGSPAAAAGVREGDVLKGWNGFSAAEHALGIGGDSWGASVCRLDVDRGGKRHQLTVPLVTLSSLLERRWSGSASSRLVRVSNAQRSPHSQAPFQFGFEASQSGGHWIISSVLPGGAAERAGFQRGDVILAMRSVESVPGILSLSDISSLDHRLTIRVRAERQGQEFTRLLTPDGLSEILRQAFPREDQFRAASISQSSPIGQ